MAKRFAFRAAECIVRLCIVLLEHQRMVHDHHQPQPLRLSLRHLREHAEAELIGNDEGTVRQPRERLRRLRAGCFIRMRKAGGENKLAHMPTQCGKLLDHSRVVNPPAGASLVIGRYCEHELAAPGPAPHPRSGSIIVRIWEAHHVSYTSGAAQCDGRSAITRIHWRDPWRADQRAGSYP